MPDLSEIYMLTSVKADSFATPLRCVADAFSAFAEQYCRGDSFFPADIPFCDTRSTRSSTHPGDIIFASMYPIPDRRLSKCMYAGMASLIRGVNGFDIRLPGWVKDNTEAFESMYYYTVPEYKAARFDGTELLFRAGVVTIEKSFSVSVGGGEPSVITMPSSYSPYALTVPDARAFSDGYTDGFAFAVHRLCDIFTPFRPRCGHTSPSDAAAYRLGAFYASLTFVRPRKARGIAGDGSLLYYFAGALTYDGAPDRATYESVYFNLRDAVESGTRISIRRISGATSDAVDSLLGSNLCLTDAALPFPENNGNAFLIVSDSRLSLPFLGYITNR